MKVRCIKKIYVLALILILLFVSGTVCTRAAYTVAMHGGYAIRDMTHIIKGNQIDKQLALMVSSPAKAAIRMKYGKVEPNATYKIIYDNEVRLVYIYSYKGIITNMRVFKIK